MDQQGNLQHKFLRQKFKQSYIMINLPLTQAFLNVYITSSSQERFLTAKALANIDIWEPGVLPRKQAMSTLNFVSSPIARHEQARIKDSPDLRIEQADPCSH